MSVCPRGKLQPAPKWQSLDIIFKERCAEEKSNYYQHIVKDLKTSNPAQWYSEVKRMAGQDDKGGAVSVE